jgi:integrase
MRLTCCRLCAYLEKSMVISFTPVDPMYHSQLPLPIWAHTQVTDSIPIPVNSESNNTLVASTNAHAALNRIWLKVDGAYSPNTIRAYKSDAEEFARFCDELNTSFLPALPNTVCDFIARVSSHSIKSASLQRKLASISAIHRFSNLSDPTKHADVRLAMRKVLRVLGNRSKQAHPITRPMIERMLSVCRDDLRGLRDSALLQVAYDTLRRRSELVSLRVEDIHWGQPTTACCQTTASILLRRSKTDPYGSGVWLHLTADASMALKRWLVASGVSEGLIFRGVNRCGKVHTSLEAGQIGRIFKRLAKTIDLNERIVKQISGHSIRVGAAQDLMRQGATLPQLMVKGGWSKTETVMRYIERVGAPVNS